ncbi:hypothetical protein GRF61_24195 [Azoarcus sp. TTM-91]|uniref:hypothetical protein n=1 Tax=Azoarcus sp. TTM-91 TaxID=2691581 RepID=UPI00145E9C12|nr:hypothetical protein [Azoarcus sp. TTM-91]NMG37564.1 hypothetical protein [Azoarcus sp. TTM-91]
MDEVSTYLDGQIRVTAIPHEMRMSHWVYAPKVEEVASGNVLLDLIGGLWDLAGAKEENEVLTLALRKYPGDSEGVSLSVRKGKSVLYLKGKAYEAVALKKELETYR